jgi:hypothetical protein
MIKIAALETKMRLYFFPKSIKSFYGWKKYQFWYNYY